MSNKLKMSKIRYLLTGLLYLTLGISNSFAQDQDKRNIELLRLNELIKLQISIEKQLHDSSDPKNADALKKRNLATINLILTKIQALKEIYENKFGDLDTPKEVIYEQDDRKNYFEASLYEQSAANSTAAIVFTKTLKSNDGGKTFNLPDSGADLCSPDQARDLGKSEEKFWNEPAPALCSGFKISNDRMATAGHCIKGPEVEEGGFLCEDISFVFGFKMGSPDDVPEVSIPASNIYKCIGVIDGELGGSDKSDWRVVRVDRPISNVNSVKIRRAAGPLIPETETVTIIGYPLGLPVKIASNGRIRDNSNKAYIIVDLDSYEGNSGSAVFNSNELKRGNLFVEGILNVGEDDFELIHPCRISKRCKNDGCRGELVTRISEIERAIE